MAAIVRWIAGSGGFLKSTADRVWEDGQGDALPDWGRDFLQGAWGLLPFLTDGFPIALGKAFFPSGLAVEQDFQVMWSGFPKIGNRFQGGVALITVAAF
jgi:hypothetical protein